MGLIKKYLEITFDLALLVIIVAVFSNLIADAIMAAIMESPPNYFSSQASQFLSYISGLSLITFLIELANNPYFAAVADAIVLIFTILGKEVLSNLSSSPQTYAQALFIVAYITYVYTNALFLFADWIPPMVQGSTAAPVIMTLDDFSITIFSVAEILYMLMALGYIPQDV